ncbi:MAG: sulfatase-like hydrolase/transferase [Verrucomicrobiales bacterium]|nr:sulfatase-like hydrolase/transferase [Verrucomicrobiales bacterium]
MRLLPFFVTLVICGWVCADTTKHPNIVLIMADDIGYECLSCYGSEMYSTPNIDKLADSGIRFNHAHSQPICTPSRVQIMTGIYNNRNYVKFGVLDPEVKTIGNYMKNAGYKTCIAGKWQLAGGFEGPVKFGFEKYCLWQLTRRPSRYPNPGLEIDGVTKDFKDGSFGPDVVVDYIQNFITENKDDPFFVYYPMIAPHWPFVPTPDHPDWDPMMWRDTTNEPGGYKDQKYWEAMVRYTDKMVGRVVDHLEKTGLRDNTLVIWTGDNGTYTGVTSQFQGEKYVGGKGSPKDAGTHVGFVASCPALFEGGQVRDDLVDFSDLLPTVVDIAGGEIPDGLDGTSLAPVFRGEERKKDYIYCWYERDGQRHKASQHTRNQRYKLYSNGKLFDTINDRLEKNDLSANQDHEVFQNDYPLLKAALDKHTAITSKMDPVQAEKRKVLTRGTKKQAKKKKKE